MAALNTPTERVFYDESGVKITNARAIFRNKTYAMAQISSVRVDTRQPKRGGAIAVFIIGALVFLAGISGGKEFAGASFLGIILIVIGGVWLASLKPTHALQLGSSSGETQAISYTKDGAMIRAIHDAISDVLIHRG